MHPAPPPDDLPDRRTELGRRLGRLSVLAQLAPAHALVAIEMRVAQLERLLEALTHREA